MRGAALQAQLEAMPVWEQMGLSLAPPLPPLIEGLAAPEARFPPGDASCGLLAELWLLERGERFLLSCRVLICAFLWGS